MQEIPVLVGYNDNLKVGELKITTEFKQQLEQWIMSTYKKDNMPVIAIGYKRHYSDDTNILERVEVTELSVISDLKQYIEYRKKELGDSRFNNNERSVPDYYATNLAGPSSARMKMV